MKNLLLLFLLISSLQVQAQKLFSKSSYDSQPWHLSRTHVAFGAMATLAELSYLNTGFSGPDWQFISGYHGMLQYELTKARKPYFINAFCTFGRLPSKLRVRVPSDAVIEGNSRDVITLDGPILYTSNISLQIGLRSTVRRNRIYKMGAFYTYALRLNKINENRTYTATNPKNGDVITIGHQYNTNITDADPNNASVGLQGTVFQRLNKKYALSFSIMAATSHKEFLYVEADYYSSNKPSTKLGGIFVNSSFVSVSLGLTTIKWNKLIPKT